MCDADFDPPSVFRRDARTARKRHECSECTASIVAGKRYTYVFGVWDGNVNTYRYCAKCSRLMVLMDAAREPYMMGGVRQSLRDCVAYEGDGVLRRIRAASRAGIGKEWQT
jgi:hypothetical protein